MTYTLEDSDTFLAATDFFAPIVKSFGSFIVVTYNDIGASLNGKGFVIQRSAATISAGSKQSLIGPYYPILERVGSSTTAGVLLWVVNGVPDSLKVAIMSISGTTLTANTSAEVDAATYTHAAIGTTTDGSKALVFYRESASNSNLCRCTISGTSITPGTPQAYVGGGNDFFATCMVGIDSDRIMMIGVNNTSGKWACQVIDVSSGITEGTLSDTTDTYPGGTIWERNLGTLLDTNKCLIGYRISNDLKVRTVNISGNNISSYGTATSWYGSLPAHAVCVASIDTTNAIISHIALSGGSIRVLVESVTIAGDVVTRAGDEYVYTGAVPNISTTFNRMGAYPIGSSYVLAAFATTSNQGEAFLLSGTPDSTPAGSYDLIHSLSGVPGGILI